MNLATEIINSYSRPISLTPRRPRRKVPSPSAGLATVCERFAWYNANKPLTSTDNPWLQRRFAYGHLHEDFIMKEIKERLKWQVKGQQMRVKLWGIPGQIDGLILDPSDNEWKLLEVKTMNPRDYALFQKEGIKAFPRYHEQATFYLAGCNAIPFADPIEKGLLLAENTYPLGQLHVEEFGLDLDLFDEMQEHMEDVAKAIIGPTPPPRPYAEDSKQCAWCPRKEECWQMMKKEKKYINAAEMEEADFHIFADAIADYIEGQADTSIAKTKIASARTTLRNLMEKYKAKMVKAKIGENFHFDVRLQEIESSGYTVGPKKYVKLTVS